MPPVPSAAEISDQLDRVAREADAVEEGEIPYIIPLGQGLLGRISAGQQVPQARVASMTRHFTALVDLLMPSGVVAAYVDRRCADENLWQHADFSPDYAMVPPWAELHDESIAPGTPASQRKGLMKFSHAEAMRCAEVGADTPQLMTSVLAFQQVVGDYLTDVRRRLHPDEAMAGQAGLLYEHWKDAGNFSKFIHGAFVMTMGADTSAAFEAMDQAGVDRMFQFLIESGSFEHVIPAGEYPSVPKGLKITCPALPILRELIVNRGSLLSVIGTVRNLARGEGDLKQVVHANLMFQANEAIAHAVRETIRPGTGESFMDLQMHTARAAQSRARSNMSAFLRPIDE